MLFTEEEFKYVMVGIKLWPVFFLIIGLYAVFSAVFGS